MIECIKVRYSIGVDERGVLFVFDVVERETNVFDAAKCGMLGLGRAEATGHKRPEDESLD